MKAYFEFRYQLPPSHLAGVGPCTCHHPTLHLGRWAASRLDHGWPAGPSLWSAHCSLSDRVCVCLFQLKSRYDFQWFPLTCNIKFTVRSTLEPLGSGLTLPSLAPVIEHQGTDAWHCLEHRGQSSVHTLSYHHTDPLPSPRVQSTLLSFCVCFAHGVPSA